jgi:serine protease inhibitor ecotin
MKLSRSTAILVNIVLVLLAALLVKGLVTAPASAGAAQSREYKVVPYPSTGQNVEQMLNAQAQEGWRFVFAHEFDRLRYSLIFER